MEWPLPSNWRLRLRDPSVRVHPSFPTQNQQVLPMNPGIPVGLLIVIKLSHRLSSRKGNTFAQVFIIFHLRNMCYSPCWFSRESISLLEDLMVLSRECGSEPKDSRTREATSWIVHRVIPFLTPCCAPASLSEIFGSPHSSGCQKNISDIRTKELAIRQPWKQPFYH